jgi:hypothetical protein
MTYCDSRQKHISNRAFFIASDSKENVLQVSRLTGRGSDLSKDKTSLVLYIVHIGSAAETHAALYSKSTLYYF